MPENNETVISPELIKKKFAWGKVALLVFLLLLLANILFLDFEVFKGLEKAGMTAKGQLIFEGKTSSPSGLVIEETLIGPAPSTEVSQVKEPDICPVACLEAIKVASQITPMPIPTSVSVVSEPTIKEFYIPLGRGSATSKDWVELTGTEAVVDMANYPNVKSIIFEASMRIPTANGKVYSKLYNVTDQHDVWYSEVWAEGPSGYRAESAEITLSLGRKLYRVMMKSTMGYEAILDSARIKILLK